LDLKTSVKVINAYAHANGITPLQALNNLDLLSHEDWMHTLSGAPKNYQRKTTQEQETAFSLFCKNRLGWKKEAQSQGVDIRDWN
jgi:hypothetical protein